MSHEEREHRSAPVLTKEQVQGRIESGQAGHDEDTELCLSHEALRAERDAALAEVARLKALVIDCIPFIGYQASVEDLKARAYEAVDYDAYCKAHYVTKEVQP